MKIPRWIWVALLIAAAWSCEPYDPTGVDGVPTCPDGDWVVYDANGDGKLQHDPDWSRGRYSEWFCVSGVEPSTGAEYPTRSP